MSESTDFWERKQELLEEGANHDARRAGEERRRVV